MSGRLVLHLGAHKTATTAIQHYCAAEAHSLRAAGVIFVGHTTKPYSTYRTLRDLTMHARGEGEFKDGSARMKLVVENSKKVLSRGDVKTLLVPWEILIGEPYVENELALYPRATVSLTAMAEALQDLPISLVFTIREQWSFLNSWYLQLHKLGRVPDPAAYLCWVREAQLSWKPAVTAMRDCFGEHNVQILNYDLDSPSPAAYFQRIFTAYGHPGVLHVDRLVQQNRSWPTEAINIARHIMPRLADDRERYIFRLKMDEAFSQLAGHPFMLLGDDIRQFVAERYGGENRILADNGNQARISN